MDRGAWLVVVRCKDSDTAERLSTHMRASEIRGRMSRECLGRRGPRGLPGRGFELGFED